MHSSAFKRDASIFAVESTRSLQNQLGCKNFFIENSILDILELGLPYSKSTLLKIFFSVKIA